MSAKNYLSARESRDKNKFECLPSITQKFAYRPAPELPPLSANTSAVYNRNLSYKFDIWPYIVSQDQGDSGRAGTPFSDFFSDSDIGTPDFLGDESDSSAGSALRQSTAEATKALADEWERIERTLYEEPGDKCTRTAMVEECKQWRQLHPQLRAIGKAIQLPEKKPGYCVVDHDEVIAMHYSDYDKFSESEERLSQSSTDVTPQNSPRPSICENLCAKRSRLSISEETYEPRLSREKISYLEHGLPDRFHSLLHITPLTVRSPPQKKQSPSILRSEIASSKWMKNSRPDSSKCDRNSAKSFLSLDTRAYNATLSASEKNKIYTNRVLTAKHRDLAKLQPLYSPDISSSDMNMNPYFANTHPYSVRKVSLPPLHIEEEKRKLSAVSSTKKHRKKHSLPSSGYGLDKVRSNYN